MESGFNEFPVYVGKIGIDNIFLIIVGLLYFVVYLQTHRGHADADLHWRTAVFFMIYGLTFDLYRLKSLRPLLLFGSKNFQLFKTGLLLFSLLFLYDGLIHAIIREWRARRKTRRLK